MSDTLPRPTRTHAAMTLGEALAIVTAPPWACACIGRAGSIDPDWRCSCRLVFDQAAMLIRAAHIAVKLVQAHIDGNYWLGGEVGPGSQAPAPTAADLAGMIRDALQAVWDAGPQMCHHVVHPAEMARGGWAICAACFTPIDLGPRP